MEGWILNNFLPCSCVSLARCLLPILYKGYGARGELVSPRVAILIGKNPLNIICFFFKWDLQHFQSYPRDTGLNSAAVTQVT